MGRECNRDGDSQRTGCPGQLVLEGRPDVASFPTCWRGARRSGQQAGDNLGPRVCVTLISRGSWGPSTQPGDPFGRLGRQCRVASVAPENRPGCARSRVASQVAGTPFLLTYRRFHGPGAQLRPKSTGT